MPFPTQILYRSAVLFVWFGIAESAIAQTSTERVITSTALSRPVFATAPSGDHQRLFIAEQNSGQIKIFDRNSGAVLATPFLQITGLQTGGERGFLGLAFDPDYANNGFFYTYLSAADPIANNGIDHHSVIRRYTVTGNPLTSSVANAGSALDILSFNQPQSNHNGGWIGFGPNDGYLYIASGDGGNGNDSGPGHSSNGNAQDITNNLLGKMLRIDVRGDDFPTDANRNYAIPTGNPFVDTTGDDEIWAYGLRNPYRSSFDRATGDLWIGDVGQGRREEIDFQAAGSSGGENYGWRLREGTIATPGVGGSPPPGNVEPIYDYTRGSGEFQGTTVIGGYVYRGPVQHFQGHYFFADNGSNNIWKLDPDAIDPRASVRRVNNQLLPDNGSISSIGSFGEDADGNLYLAEVFGDEVFRVTTASQDMLWNGDDATAGVAGDGVSWSSANNWTRSGTVDQSFTAEDHVLFVAGSTQSNINLGADRTASAVTFQAPYTLENSTLEVLSGNVTVNPNVTASIASNLQAESADHSLRKLGAGTLLVDGIAGQAVVKSGTLGGNGTLDYLKVEADAAVAPGAGVGTLEIINSLVLEPDSTLELEIGGAAPGESDQLLVGGTASLDGTLAVTLVDGFVPQAGDSFGFLAATGGTGGMFAALDLPGLGPNLGWLINSGGITVSLLVSSTLEGDFDNDGDVDDQDLLTWEMNVGTSGGAGRSQGDADDDFDVDGADFLRWQRQFTGSTASSAAAVPEPTSWSLLALGWLAGLSFCRHTRIFF